MLILQVSKTHVEGRAVTRLPDVVKEIKRGSMKVYLVYNYIFVVILRYYTLKNKLNQ